MPELFGSDLFVSGLVFGLLVLWFCVFLCFVMFLVFSKPNQKHNGLVFSKFNQNHHGFLVFRLPLILVHCNCWFLYASARGCDSCQRAHFVLGIDGCVFSCVGQKFAGRVWHSWAPVVGMFGLVDSGLVWFDLAKGMW